MMEIIMYISRWLLYICLLATSGVIIVNSLLGMKWEQGLKGIIQLRTQQLAKGFLFTVLLALCVQLILWIEQFGIQDFQWKELLLNTSTGKVYIYLLVLGCIGLFIPKFEGIFSMIWAWLLLLAESMNGHIAAIEGNQFGILFDFIHLSCAAIWIGGLIHMWLVWRHEQTSALQFLNKLTKMLWLSIALVSVSGIILTILILPSWTYLLYTAWGRWLLLKIALICVTIWCGYQVRNKILKQQRNTKRAMSIEATLLAFIIVLATIISSISPSPSMSNALNIHKMGEELHYTVKLTPNAPGPNQLSLTLWTLVEEGTVDSVKLSMYAEEKSNRSKRTLELQQAELEDDFEFANFNESRFVIKDLELPYPSKWQAIIEMTFTDGHQQSFKFTFSNK